MTIYVIELRIFIYLRTMAIMKVIAGIMLYRAEAKPAEVKFAPM